MLITDYVWFLCYKIDVEKFSLFSHHYVLIINDHSILQRTIKPCLKIDAHTVLATPLLHFMKQCSILLQIWWDDRIQCPWRIYSHKWSPVSRATWSAIRQWLHIKLHKKDIGGRPMPQDNSTFCRAVCRLCYKPLWSRIYHIRWGESSCICWFSQ